MFVSYEIQPQGTDTDLYKLKVNVTNVGEGPAKGIVIFAPDIPLHGDAAEIRSAYSYKFGKSSDNSIRIGDLFSGETSYGEFVVYAPGIDDWTKLPALAVKTQRTGDVVTAPLSLQRYDREGYIEIIDALIDELTFLAYNIEQSTNRMGNSLVDAILISDKLYRDMVVAETATYAFEAMSNIASLASVMSGLK